MTKYRGTPSTPHGGEREEKMVKIVSIALALMLACASVEGKEGKKPNSRVILHTSKGNITLELYPEKAPVTVKNFLSYVNEGYYDGLIFHRVIEGFMIQGGGFLPGMKAKHPTHSPIKNEAGNGLKNVKGSIAMARTQVVDSATSQFFINTVDNSFLDHKDSSARGFGYAVFGRVIEGLDVVDQIAHSPTHTSGMHQDVPKVPIIIEKAQGVPAP